MNIARPRLLAGSLAVAALAVVGFAVVAARSGDDGDVDARLADAADVAAPPSLVANGDVEGEPLPMVRLGDRDGNDVETASFLGEPLVINLWFSTCGPCARELPDFAAVHAEVGDDVRFIGVNPYDQVEVMDRFAADKGVSYELYRDDFAEFTDAVGAANFPITLFVTPDGSIVEQTGVIDADTLRDEIDRLLEASA